MKMWWNSTLAEVRVLHQTLQLSWLVLFGDHMCRAAFCGVFWPCCNGPAGYLRGMIQRMRRLGSAAEREVKKSALKW